MPGACRGASVHAPIVGDQLIWRRLELSASVVTMQVCRAKATSFAYKKIVTFDNHQSINGFF